MVTDFLSKYLLPIKIIAVLAVAGLLAYAYSSFTNHHQGIGYDRGYSKANSEWLEKERVAEDERRKAEIKLGKAHKEAIDAEAKRYKQLRADYDAVRRANLGVRDTIGALRGQTATASIEACRETVDAALVVFGECSVRLGEVAEAADGHANDARTCREAWPELTD